MLGRLAVNVPDLQAAKRYYGRLMPLLDFEPFLDAEDEFAYMPSHGKRGTYIFFYPSAVSPSEKTGAYSRRAIGLQHLAFMVPTRAVVHRVHDLVVELGNEVLYAPQEFPRYGSPYFAVFWTDPFGFMLEAVCHHDRD
jgi:catechol 2,3-dioxygenase-like lactoylglutathione lyase family enzyme